MNARRIGVGAFAGLLSTVALAFSPIFAGTPPLVPPYVPIDLRFVILPVAFAGLQAAAEHGSWPAPAATVLGSAVLASVGANLAGSQVLAYLGVPWATGGMEVPLGAFAGSLGAVLAGLWVAVDAASEVFEAEMTERGVSPDEIGPVLATASARGREAIAVAGLAAGGLALIARLLAAGLGSSSVPFPELAAIAMVLAAGALLLGLPRREAEAA